MGYELAASFVAAGREVMLVSGLTHLDVPDATDFIPVETAADMFEVVAHHIGRMGVVM